jgi:DNA-binding HxlR family transcriptional regulator
MAGKADLSKFNCSLARALAEIGDWWTLLIVRDAFIGSSRFSEFQRSLGVARNILSDRLGRLCTADILTRDGPERRPRYRLTEKGRSLLTPLVALQQWGDAWAAPKGPPVVVTDARGRAVRAVRLEDQTGREIGTETVRFKAGPGANPRTRRFLAAVPSEPRTRRRRGAS